MTEQDAAGLTAALLVLSEARGTDSTGLASWRAGDATPTVQKAVCAGSAFIVEEAEAVAHAARPGAGWVIGHTRTKTQGAVNLANAHPFVFGDVLGAHNGVIVNDAALADDVKGVTLPGCDSAVLFAHAAQHGLAKTLAKATGTINLALSVAPYNRVGLYQGHATGLSLAYIPAWHAAVWASDDHYIRQACALLGVKVEYAPDGDAPGYYMALDTEALLWITPDTLSKTCTWDKEAAPLARRAITPYTRFGYETWPDKDTAYTPRKGFHPSLYTAGVYHRGKRKACRTCQDYERSSLGHGSRAAVGGLRTRLIVTSQQGAANVVTDVWPPVGCPNCHRPGRLSGVVEGCAQAEDTALDCLACGVSIEPLESFQGEVIGGRDNADEYTQGWGED